MKWVLIGFLFLSSVPYSINIDAADGSAQQNIKKPSMIDILTRMEQKYQQLELRQEITPQSFNRDNLPLSNDNVAFASNIKAPVEVLQAGIPEGEELLLSIYINNLYLGDIFGFKSKQGAKINLQDLFSVLEFPIDIDMNEKIAKGWFIAEDKTFHWDFGTIEQEGQQSRVNIEGKLEFVDENAIHIQDNELFVEGALVSKWFGLNATNTFNDLRITLIPNESLPIQLRLARKNKTISSSSNNQVTLPWKESSYQVLSSPLLDFQLRAVEGSGNNANNVSYSALGSHDLAFMNAEYYIGGEGGKGVRDARVKFSEELKAGTFWFLPAASFEFGDINAVTINKEFNGGLNRGISFSKARSDVNDNQRININGDIQPGWDIELYQNNIIIAQQTSIQSGRYEFNNVDLVYGNNNFEIISYGPQGQVRKEYREVFIDSNALKKSEQNYAFSLTQQGRSLLNVNDDLASGNSGLLFAGKYSVGLTDWLSVTLGQSSLLSDNGDDDAFNYSGAVSLSLFERLLLNASINIDENEQYKSDFSARTQWLGQSLFYSFINQELQSVGVDEVILKNNDVLHVLSMSGSLPNFSNYRLNYSNNLAYSDKGNGNKITNIQNLVSVSAGRFAMQSSLIWTKNKTLADVQEILRGSMLMQGRLGATFTRWAVNYSLYPESKIDSITSQFSWEVYGSLQSDFKLDYIPDEKFYRATLGLTWRHENFNLTSNFTYNDQDDWSAGLFLRFGIGYDVINKKSFISANALARHGAMAVRVFEDKNNDGILDDDETIFEGVKIKAIQSSRQAVTGSDGLAIIKNLPVYVKTDIVIDPNSLDDPFLIPSSDGVSITPRKGFLERIDYPVVSSSEVDGTVYAIDAEGNERSLGFVPVHLKNAEGEIVQSTQSEYDGYYLFVDLLPGQYTVSVDENHLKKHRLKNVDDIAVNLTAQGDIINGSDFTVQELAFTEGFVANVGEFNNLSMLKVYWHLIQRRYRAVLKQKAFYVQNEDSGHYMLNLGFYPDSKQAEQACGKTTEASIDCAVKAYEFAIQ
jgi:hypothetical protein